MKALFIGGTGTISTAIVKRLVNELNWEVWILNRGNRSSVLPEGVHQIIADINDEADVAEKDVCWVPAHTSGQAAVLVEEFDAGG